MNVARSSLEELLLDYEDYLRHRRLALWAPSSRAASAVREVPRRFKENRTDQSNMTDLSDSERWALYARWLEHERAEVRANAIICLIHQANYLLDRQIAALEAAFVEEWVQRAACCCASGRAGAPAQRAGQEATDACQGDSLVPEMRQADGFANG